MSILNEPQARNTYACMDLAGSYWVSRSIDRIHLTFLLDTYYFHVHLCGWGWGGGGYVWAFQFLHKNLIQGEIYTEDLQMFLLLYIKIVNNSCC
jgi:hypothetical protein